MSEEPHYTCRHGNPVGHCPLCNDEDFARYIARRDALKTLWAGVTGDIKDAWDTEISPTQAAKDLAEARKMMIHPTAIIDCHARIGESTTVGPWTIIGGEAQVRPPRKPEDMKPVVIGDGNIIRELCSIHDGAWINDNCFIMAHTHVGHDCIISDDVTLVGAKLAGHCLVMCGANVGLNATLHQHVIVGAYAMVGAGAVVIDHVPPFTKVAGNPARVIGTNTRGLERAREKYDIVDWWDNQFVHAWQESRRLRNKVYPRGVCKNKDGSVHLLG